MAKLDGRDIDLASSLLLNHRDLLSLQLRGDDQVVLTDQVRDGHVLVPGVDEGIREAHGGM